MDKYERARIMDNSWCGHSGATYARDSARGYTHGAAYKCYCGKELVLRDAMTMRWVMVPRHKKLGYVCPPK